MSRYEEIDLAKIKRSSIRKRRSKARIKDFAKVVPQRASISQFLDSLPRFLKACDFKKLVDQLFTARKRKKPIIFMLGAHPIKCGLSPIVIDLMQKGRKKHHQRNVRNDKGNARAVQRDDK